jgi:hypothetical protein
MSFIYHFIRVVEPSYRMDLCIMVEAIFELTRND